MSTPARSRSAAPSASPQLSAASSSTLHSRRSGPAALPTDSSSPGSSSFESPRLGTSPRIGGGEDDVGDDDSATAPDSSPQSSLMNGRHRTGTGSSRPRSHGGFLLDTSLAPGRRTRLLLRQRGYDSPESKSKKRRVADDVARGKNLIQSPKHYPSSPLAMHSINAASDDGGMGHAEEGASRQAHSASIPTRHDSPRQQQSDHGPSIRFQDVRERDEGAPSFGLNIDPAQIVNLALNLSEGRRRTANMGRQASISNRRVSSMGQPQSGMDLSGFPLGEGAGAALREHLRQQRRISYNVPTTPRKVSTAISTGKSIGGGIAGSGSGEIGDGFMLDQNYHYQFSASTLARAEKARNFFELSNECRRLLQYLPPIKPRISRGSKGASPPKTQESLSRATTRSNDWQELGREYNPLQCIRNRKVRARERMSIDFDAEGWTDPDKVADWVDEIGSESVKGEMAYGDGSLLPPYGPGGPGQNIGADEQGSNKAGNHRRGGSTHVKPRRPRMDWSVNPAEILADAFWLEQGNHRTLIEDKDGFKIFPGASRSKPTSAHAPAHPPFDADSEMHEASPPQETLKVWPMSHHYGEGGVEFVREQLRLENHLRKKQSRGRSAESSSRKRRRRKQERDFSPSVSSSSTDTSEDENSRGLRGRLAKARRSREQMEEETVEKRMLDMVEKEANELGLAELTASPQAANGQDKMPHDNSPRRLQLPNSHSSSVTQLDDGIESRRQSRVTLSSQDSSKQLQSNRPPPGDSNEALPRSSLAEGSIPDIAVSSSAPPSRTASPIRKLFSAASKSNRKVESYPVSETDFAIDGGDDDSDAQEPTNMSPVQTLSHRDTAELRPRESTESTKRGRLFKKEKEGEPKGRGFFKGTKLEALLKREAGRMGDMFWRKDEPNNASIKSSRSSIEADGSAAESETSSPVEKRPRPRDRNKDDNDDSPTLSRKTTVETPPKYHMNNLPTFTPQRGPQASTPEIRTPAGDWSVDRDHLDPQKRNRLAQPATPNISRLSTQEPDGEMGEMEGISRNTTQTDLERMDTPQGPTVGDSRVNAALGLPGRVFRGYGPPVTGLARLGAMQENKSPLRPTLKGMRHWSIADRELPLVQTAVSRQEIARIRALLLCSGVKAKEINRRAREVRSPADSLLSITTKREHDVPRVEEHVVAARYLGQEFENGVQNFNEVVKLNSNTRVAKLHERLASLQDRFEGKLTPLVQGLADEADFLNTELTTTRTLALKQLNDSLGFVIRNRRGTLRWARKLGFLLLEWTLLTLMWCVWFIVVVVRWVRRILHAIMAVIRWLFLM